MTTNAGTACPFCHPAPERIIFENPLVTALWDASPVNRGHALIVPRRHVPTWFDASAEERVALMAAGQTVFHLHVHLIPRYDGDVPDPRGGVRWVIPARGNYLSPPSASSGRTVPPETSAAESPTPDRSRLISGGADDPLLHCLSEEFTRADQVDIAVGFVMPSGVRRIETHLRDFLERGGRLRLLTGDYLDVTDPDALVRLLDLEGHRQLRVFETGSGSPVAFHPKAYVFMRAGGDGVAFVGSSNLSESALLTGIEWSYRTVSSTDAPAFAGITQVFESLFHHSSTRELTAAWVDGYRQRRKIAPRSETAAQPVDIEPEPRPVVSPHAVQLEALAALEKTRADGNTAGLGKTWLAAFDFERFFTSRQRQARLLYVAHRQESRGRGGRCRAAGDWRPARVRPGDGVLPARTVDIIGEGAGEAAAPGRQRFQKMEAEMFEMNRRGG